VEREAFEDAIFVEWGALIGRYWGSDASRKEHELKSSRLILEMNTKHYRGGADGVSHTLMKPSPAVASAKVNQFSYSISTPFFREGTVMY
jgi:hypothetical protein